MKTLIFFVLKLSCANQNPTVVIETELGSIKLEIYQSKAPVTSANFLNYVDRSLYSHGSFYRTVTMDNQPNNEIKIEVIQGGIRIDSLNLAAIRHESTKETGIKHHDGTISMARADTGTVTSHFFICVNDQPELDFAGKRNPDGQGFAAFGRVIDGMEIVKQIQTANHNGQQLDPEIRILSIKRVGD